MAGLVAAAGCTVPANAPKSSSMLFLTACTGGSTVSTVGRITTPGVVEASGIVASRRTADVWWTHNDAGNPNRIYAISGNGSPRATVVVDNAQNRDWEDIAAGPGVRPGDASLLYIGDTGNNQAIKDAAHARRSVRIYRMSEPAIPAGGGTVHARAAAITLNYPDGAHDAEAIFVDPISGDLIVISKEWSGSGRAGVYRSTDIARRGAGSVTTLQKVATVSLPGGTLVTGADITRDGRVIALRSYDGVHIYQRDTSRPVWSAFSNGQCRPPRPADQQGESIGFAPDGGSYLTTSEGTRPPIYRTVQ